MTTLAQIPEGREQFKSPIGFKISDGAPLRHLMWVGIGCRITKIARRRGASIQSRYMPRQEWGISKVVSIESGQKSRGRSGKGKRKQRSATFFSDGAARS